MERNKDRRDSIVIRTKITGELKYRAVEALTRLYVPEIYTEGQENLETVRKLRQAHVPTMLVPNHLSNADAPVISSSMVRVGYSDISDDLVSYLGLRLLQVKFLNKFLDGYSHIPVWPTTEDPETETERVQALQMNRSAKVATNTAIKRGKTLCLFIEGGRAYDSTLKDMSKIKPALGHSLLSIPDLVVVPTGIIGTENVLPVGKLIPRVANVRVRYGEPIKVADVGKKYAYLPREEKHSMVAQDLMYAIADLLPGQYKQAYLDRDAA